MKLETFIDIVTTAKNMINFIDEDPQVDLILKAGINHWYTSELSKLSRNVVKGQLIPIQGTARLPEDCLSIINFDPPLKEGDKIIPDSDMLLTAITEPIKILYNALREPLVNDDDIPDCNKKYFYPMALYGCYSYYMHRKKEVEAREYYAWFLRALDGVKTDNAYQDRNVSSYAGYMKGDLY